MEPFLGLAVGNRTWVLAAQPICEGGKFQGCTEPAWKPVGQGWYVDRAKLVGVMPAREIHYWGHYPIADLEYEIDAPVSAGLRAWAPFIPGDAATSNTPGAIFEVRVRNTSRLRQRSTLAFSFPGPTREEALLSDDLFTLWKQPAREIGYLLNDSPHPTASRGSCMDGVWLGGRLVSGGNAEECNSP